MANSVRNDLLGPFHANGKYCAVKLMQICRYIFLGGRQFRLKTFMVSSKTYNGLVGIFFYTSVSSRAIYGEQVHFKPMRYSFLKLTHRKCQPTM